MEGIFGLAAFGFWMFIAAVSVGGIWDGIRKREAEHETLRRMIETGKEPDPLVVDKLLGHKKEPERDLKVGGLITFSVSPGMALMGWFISLKSPDALLPIIGVACLIAFVGIGLLTAAAFLKRARREDAAENQNIFR